MSSNEDRDGSAETQRHSRLFKLLRRGLARSAGMRSKHGANLALDILEANGVVEVAVSRAGGRLVHVSTRDKVVASEVVRTGTFAWANMEAFARFLAARGLDPATTAFVNVGANIGTACLNAYDCGFRRFIAVEPEPDNFRLLQSNLAGLAGADVRCIPSAIGDAPGRARLHRHPRNLGSHSLLGSSRGDTTGADTIEVSVETLSAIASGQGPFVLFVDVEGFEPQVLRGGTEAIERGCRAIALEVTPARYAARDASDLHQRLAALSDEFSLLPSLEAHPIDRLPTLMHAHARGGHFDIALARSGSLPRD